MEDAEDISQEVFLEVFRSIGHYKKNASVHTWIYRITVNKSLDHLRKQKRRNVFNQLKSFIQVSHDGITTNTMDPPSLDTRNADNEKRKIMAKENNH